MIEIQHFKTLGSTNTWIKENIDLLQAPVAVMTDEQTAGRGQRGNIWLSAKGENLLCSILFEPENLPAMSQFSLSEAVALSICNTLQTQFNIKADIKWPNDIYVDGKKIAGILIENSLKASKVAHTIIGIGLNLNQSTFPPELPNPTSAVLLSGKEANPEDVLGILLREMEAMLPLVSQESGRDSLHKAYTEKLWRNDGKLHPFIDRTVGAEASRFTENPAGPAAPHAYEMMARIEHIAPTGHLHLRDSEGTLRVFAFKEVEFKLL